MMSLSDLAAEFVHVYELLREAVGSTAAALESRVQRARLRYAAARRGLWIVDDNGSLDVALAA